MYTCTVTGTFRCSVNMKEPFCKPTSLLWKMFKAVIKKKKRLDVLLSFRPQCVLLDNKLFEKNNTRCDSDFYPHTFHFAPTNYLHKKDENVTTDDLSSFYNVGSQATIFSDKIRWPGYTRAILFLTH